MFKTENCKNSFLFKVDPWSLAELYQQERVLWDIRNTCYFNKKERKDALERIAATTGMDADKVKSKLRNMRTYYNSEKNRIKRVIEGSEDGVSGSTWPIYHLLDSFLSDVVGQRPTKPNSDEVAFYNMCTDDDDDYNASQEHHNIESLDETASTSSENRKRTDECSQSNGQLSKKQMTNSKVGEAVKVACDTLRSITAELHVDDSTDHSVQIDEDAKLFGKMVEADFKKLKNRRVRHNIKMKILDLLYQGTLEDEVYEKALPTS